MLNARTTEHPVYITFGNGEASKATQVGDVLLQTPTAVFLLKEVLHVPGASAHLLSVRTATKNGIRFSFGADSCKILRQDKVLAEALCNEDIIYFVSGTCSKSKPALTATARVKETPEMWHKRFGHLSYNSLARLQAGNMVTGINIPAEQFKAADGFCEPCALGKQHREPFPTSTSTVKRPLALLHTDMCGPLAEKSNGGNNYFMTVLDEYTKLSVAQPLPRKSDAAAALKDIITQLENMADCKVQRLRCDNGSEYINDSLKSFCSNKGISLETSVRYTPEQNGAAERLNRTLMEKVRPMLSESGLPKKYWAEALATANYVRNRSPVSDRDKTPWELFFGSKPDVSHLLTFGERVYAHVPKQLRSKLDDTSQPGRFLGYPSGTKGFKILLDNGKIIISRDVIIPRPPSSPAQHNLVGDDNTAAANNDQMDTDDTIKQHRIQVEVSAPRRPKTETAGIPETVLEDRLYESTTGSKLIGDKRKQAYLAAGVAFSANILEPTSLEEALASEQADDWKLAIDEEYSSLIANKTWELEQPPPDVTPIPVKWVFKIKRHSSGEIERFKARLVVKGYRQQEGIDFEEVYAPVSKYSTVRAVLSMAATADMEIHQLDIKTAFLNGELEEEVWCTQPPGYEQGTGLACHLLKSLYGLKQTPRAWHLRLKAELEKMQFTESAADPGLFIKTGAQPIYLLIYVDDIVLVSNYIDELTNTKQQLMTVFEARDLGSATFYLGMDIIRDRTAKTITLAQQRLTRDLLEKYKMTNANSVNTPLSLATKLTKEGTALDTAIYPYSQLIGSLMYLSVCTRPDISQAVGALARYMAQPTETHWQAAKHVLRYLAGTAKYGITFGAGSPGLDAYCDADYAGDRDTRRSTTGYVFILNGGAFSWSSRLQQTVAVSTTEAEYMAAAAAIKEALWVKRLLVELSMDIGTITIKADNQSAIKLLKNPVISMRSKHIDVIYHFARERVNRKDVAFEYISTSKMVADMLTKPMPAVKLNFCRTAMGITCTAQSGSAA